MGSTTQTHEGPLRVDQPKNKNAALQKLLQITHFNRMPFNVADRSGQLPMNPVRSDTHPTTKPIHFPNSILRISHILQNAHVDCRNRHCTNKNHIPLIRPLYTLSCNSCIHCHGKLSVQHTLARNSYGSAIPSERIKFFECKVCSQHASGLQGKLHSLSRTLRVFHHAIPRSIMQANKPASNIYHAETNQTHHSTTLDMARQIVFPKAR